MQRTVIIACLALIFCSTFALAVPEGQIAQLEQRAEKATSTVTAEFAKDLLDAAKSSLGNAKINFAAGKEKLATRQLEMAEIQLNAADAKAAEKELQEKVAVRRSELKKLETRLERFRQGGEN